MRLLNFINEKYLKSEISFGFELEAIYTKDEYLGWIYDQVIKIFNFINNTDLDLINKLVKPTSLKNIQYNYKLLNINLKDQLNNK